MLFLEDPEDKHRWLSPKVRRFLPGDEEEEDQKEDYKTLYDEERGKKATEDLTLKEVKRGITRISHRRETLLEPSAASYEDAPPTCTHTVEESSPQ